MSWIHGDISDSETLTDADHLYAGHINEIRNAVGGEVKSHQIYCVGDSLTVGIGCTRYGIWQEKLNSLLGSLWKVNGNGIGGTFAYDMDAFFQALVVPNNDCEYFIIWGGVNDISNPPYADAATVEARLQAIYNDVASYGIKVVALTIPFYINHTSYTESKKIASDAVNAWLKAMPSNVDYVVDVYSLLEDPARPGYMADIYNGSINDWLHFGDLGAEVVGQGIYDAVTWTPNSTSKVIDGWVEVEETWTYHSATEVTILGDYRNKYQKGDRIKYKQDATYQIDVQRYAYVVASPSYDGTNTTLTLSGGSDYVLVNDVINEIYYSKEVNPRCFPHWFNWLPTLTGGTTDITYTGNARTRFNIVGKTLFFEIGCDSVTMTGAGEARHSLPVIGTQGVAFVPAVINNGGAWTIAQASIDPANGHVGWMKTSAAGSWAGGETSAALYLKGFYEI